MWVVFSHTEISWVFECSAILDCILDIFNVLRLWVLFESYLCFSRQLVCLGSGYKFWPAFCGSWFQYQSHFQSVVLFDFVLQKLLSGQCGTWAVIHRSWVLKNVVCSWGPDWCTCSLGVAKDLWRPLWSHLWSHPRSPRSSLYLLVCQEPLCHPPTNLGLIYYPLWHTPYNCSGVHGAEWWEDGKGEKEIGVCSTFIRGQLFCSEEKFLFP